jgi:hypothetical protein
MNMDMNYLSPYIRVAQDSLVQSGMQLKNRVIFDYELIYIKSGEAQMLWLYTIPVLIPKILSILNLSDNFNISVS